MLSSLKFISINSIKRKKRELDILRLKTLVDNYESRTGCCEGYYTPHNINFKL